MPAQNAIHVIAPYWHHGTWVFDDPRVQLVQEPFVAGVPEILDALVSDIPEARRGFRLLFSAAPFPGYQARYVRQRPEFGGVWYRTEFGTEGWLCSALFRYFVEPPSELYVRAERLAAVPQTA